MKLLDKAFYLVILLVCSLSCSKEIDQSGQNNMFDRYLLDTLTIDNPVIVVYEDDLFIMSRDSVTKFASNPCYQENTKQKIFRMLPHNVRMDILGADVWRINSDFTQRAMDHMYMSGSRCCNLYSPGFVNYAYRTVYEGKVGCVEYYSFNPQPKRFALELVYYDPHRYKYNPYGRWHVDYWPVDKDEIDEEEMRRIEEYVSHYMNKLDSLERILYIPKEDEEPHYMFTVEPLYSREAMNDNVKESSCELARFTIRSSKFPWGVFIDLRPKYYTKRYVKKHGFDL